MYPGSFKKVIEIINLNRKKVIIFLNLDKKFLIIILCLLINFNVCLEIEGKNIIFRYYFLDIASAQHFKGYVLSD